MRLLSSVAASSQTSDVITNKTKTKNIYSVYVKSEINYSKLDFLDLSIDSGSVFGTCNITIQTG